MEGTHNFLQFGVFLLRVDEVQDDGKRAGEDQREEEAETS